MPSQPVSLTAEQVRALNEKLAAMRHDINNNLSLIMAAAELIRHKPQMAERMMETLTEQPPKITGAQRSLNYKLQRASLAIGSGGQECPRSRDDENG